MLHSQKIILVNYQRFDSDNIFSLHYTELPIHLNIAHLVMAMIVHAG